MKRTLGNRWNSRFRLAGVGFLIVTLSLLLTLNSAQAEGGIYWNESQGMDNLLSDPGSDYADGKTMTEDETILLELDADETAAYRLYYYLEDGRQTLVEFDQTSEAMEIAYYVRQYDGSGTFDYNDAVEDQEGFTPITETLIATDYREMDYDLTVPDWKDVTDKEVTTSGAITFSIPVSSSNAYTGVAFEIDNKYVFIKWDQAEDLVYFQTTGYQGGKLMPIRYETPTDGIYEKTILKQLQDFTVTPTHYMYDGTENVDVGTVFEPDPSMDPGDKPGMDIRFRQPMVLDETDWSYDYGTDLDDLEVLIGLRDFGTGDNNQFGFGLNMDGDKTISNADNMSSENSNVVYNFTPDDGDGDDEDDDNMYTIHLVRSKTDADDPTQDLVDPETFLAWDVIEASSIYDVTVTFQRPQSPAALKEKYENHELADIKPSDGFANTYMAYELIRSGANEGYLEVAPYNVGSLDEIEYLILNDEESKNPLDIRKDLWLQSYYSGEGDESVYIPIKPKSDYNQDSYQIVTVYNSKYLYSQVVTYNASEDSSYPITIPTIEDVDNLTVVPPVEVPENEEDYLPVDASMDLVWEAPDNSGEIKELDEIFEKVDTADEHLYYELYVNQLPADDAETDNYYELIKVFEVTKDGDDYKLTMVQSSTSDGTPSDEPPYEDGYTDRYDRFRMNDINIRDNDGWAKVITAEDDGTYTVTAEEADFGFPGVNYLVMRAVTVIRNDNGDLEVERTNSSIPVSLSLNMTVINVPIVDGLDYAPLVGTVGDNNSGVILEWLGVDESTYVDNMLPPGSTLTTLDYRVYIAEEGVDMDDLEDNDSLMADAVDPGNIGTGQLTIDGEQVTKDYVNLTDYVGDLRDDQIVWFEINDDGASKYEQALIGLDLNQNYNIRIVTQMTISGETETRDSEASDILSVLVPQTPGDPDDGETIPLTPQDLTVVPHSDDSTNALLSWTIPEEMVFMEDGIGFEIVAVEDVALSTAQKEKTIQLEDLLEDYLSEVVSEGWRLYEDNNETILEKYELDSDGVAQKTVISLPQGQYNGTDIEAVSEDLLTFMVLDDANSPNRVNYYYVRTVEMVDDTPGSASTWVPGFLTTAQVSAPYNLIVDYSDDHSFDGKDELIIRFDVPFGDADLIPDDYEIEIHIKGEDDTDYTLSKYDRDLIDSTNEDITAGHTRLWYRLSELEPGTTYSIKVLIVDKTEEPEVHDGEETYPKSSFSETVVSRTEFDQESYDKDNKYKEYLDYYRDKAEALTEQPYFIIESGGSTTAVKYRESYTDGLLQRYQSDEFYLYTDNNTHMVYYIPSVTLEAINDGEVTLVVENQDQEVRIRPDTIGSGLTEEVKDVIEDIDSYDDDTEDYYLRLEVTVKAYNSKINGYSASSPKVTVELGIVPSDYTEEALDELLVFEMEDQVEANVDNVIEDLEASLEDGIDETELLEIVQDALEDVREDFAEEAEEMFDAYTDSPDAIDEVDVPLLVGLLPEDVTSAHYAYEGGEDDWQFVNSSYFSRRYHVESTELNPLLTVSPGNTAMGDTYGQEGVDVINTFNLGGVFSTSDFESEDKPVSKDQWFEAVARVLGAGSSDDPVDYLEDSGIVVDEGNLAGTLLYDEGLALYAEAYALRHNLDLDRAYVTDYYSIEDIDQVDEAYKQTLLQGVSLGIIQTRGGFIYPDHEMTVEDAMDLLTDLHLGSDDQ